MPDKIKLGDRVEYRAKPNRPGGNHTDGRTGVVTHLENNGHASVKWDDGNTSPSFPFLHNLELITVKIDTTKPLEVFHEAVPAKAVTFVTETSDGHVLVSRPGHWAIFDYSGKFVRSSDGMGVALMLRNKPELVVRYQVASSISTAFQSATWRTLEEARGVDPRRQILKVTSLDGKIVDVELVR